MPKPYSMKFAASFEHPRPAPFPLRPWNGWRTCVFIPRRSQRSEPMGRNVTLSIGALILIVIVVALLF